MSLRAVLATSNPGKERELAAILEGSGLEVSARPLWIGHEETGTSHLENARLKASAVMRLTRLPVLAEDSGLEVDALGGLPGLRSARFSDPGATDARNNHKLLKLLDGTPEERRSARYRAVAVLLLPSARVLVGEGVFEGRVAGEPRGDGGFGYDPLFIPEGETRTAAELSPEEKNARSHRAAAVRALVAAAREAGLL